MTARYVPILKAKAAEITVLINESTTVEVVPVFELLPAPKPRKPRPGETAKRTKGTATDVGYFFDDIERLWNGAYYMDLRHLPGSIGSWWDLVAAYRAIQGGNKAPIPVVDIGDASSTPPSFATLARAAERAALRVPFPHGNTGKILQAVRDIATATGLSPRSVDVIVDWSTSIANVNLDTAESHSEACVLALVPIAGRVVIAGTIDDSDIAQAGDWTMDRREWWAWLRLHAKGIDVDFGDYALYEPKPPAPATPLYGHLRYSYEDKIDIHRSGPNRSGGLGPLFAECCSHLVSTASFRPALSAADARISAIAAGEDEAKAAGTWREISFGHHLQLVNEQLQNPPAAPPPGTD